jgi:hypothetical protein
LEELTIPDLDLIKQGEQDRRGQLDRAGSAIPQPTHAGVRMTSDTFVDQDARSLRCRILSKG